MNAAPTLADIRARIAEITAREQAATKGPWGFYDGDTYIDIAADLEMTGIGSYSYREKIAQLDDQDPPEELDEEQASELMVANAEFITASREDVPFLLDLLAKYVGLEPTVAEENAHAASERDRLNGIEDRLRGLQTALETGMFPDQIGRYALMDRLDAVLADEPIESGAPRA